MQVDDNTRPQAYQQAMTADFNEYLQKKYKVSAVYARL